MYVDLGGKRVRIHLSVREWAAIGTLLCSGISYIARTEVSLLRVRQQLAVCQDSVKVLREAQAAATNKQHAVRRVHTSPPNGN